MPFEKGNKYGNRNGRPKGATNKSSNKIRDAYTKLLEENIDVIKEDIEKLKPAERVRFFLDLSKYIIPTLKATEHDISDDLKDVFNMPVTKFFNVETE